jgi:serine/threonine protein kinase
MKDEYSKRKVF